jgi:PD-(D/E)XK nuclease superfamily
VALNPAQQEIVDRLRGERDNRTAFDGELRHHLRAIVEHGTADAIAALSAKETVFVSKSRLAGVHGCEERFLHDDFAWSIPAARGKVAHKAIELSLHWREQPAPLGLVDEAMARLTTGIDPFATWLQGLREVERAELRAEANERVVQFLECWPPLPHAWRPSTEMSLRQDLHGAKMTLQGKVDLTLGAPDGLVAGKVLIDLKTGNVRHVHRDDLRFYALIETMRLGTPPLRLASYYLDQAALHL